MEHELTVSIRLRADKRDDGSFGDVDFHIPDVCMSIGNFADAIKKAGEIEGVDPEVIESMDTKLRLFIEHLTYANAEMLKDVCRVFFEDIGNPHLGDMVIKTVMEPSLEDHEEQWRSREEFQGFTMGDHTPPSAN